MEGRTRRCAGPGGRPPGAPRWLKAPFLRHGALALPARQFRLRVLLGGVVIGREDRVELPPGIGEDLLRLRHLRGRADLHNLHAGHRDRAEQLAQFDRVRAHAAGHVVPGRADLVGVRGHILAPLGGQRVALAAALRRLSLDQALVLQLLEGGVDRPWAGLPDAATALGDLLDQLVAVPRLLGEQRQRRGPDVTAPHPRPTVHFALGPPGADTEAHRAPGTPRAATAPRAAGPATACAATPPATAPVFLAGCPVFGSMPVFMMFMHLRTPYSS